jgi:class 3 adenylate cyclase/ABC-type nitrate/sulfonate/bicarbonate transport system substrate-binding protein
MTVYQKQTTICGNRLSTPELAMLRRLIIAVGLVLTAIQPAAALDQVSLQLKWQHQFQFAGYYAASEKGLYRDAGLDVAIREGGPDVDVDKVVADGGADFGVCTSSVLLDRANGRNLVVLGVIFQHSAAIILVPRRAGISSLSELKGRRLMDEPGSGDVAAMLNREGVNYATLPRVPNDGDPRGLLTGKADAMLSYSTDEPFALDRIGASYLTFSPRAYGIDFYGDSFCTSARQAKEHPERVSAFRSATLKGWKYALSHQEEIVDLILQRYSQRKSRDALVFEARRAEALIQPDLIELGSQNAQHWKHIADTYRNLGMLSAGSEPEWRIFPIDETNTPDWLEHILIGLGSLGVLIALIWLCIIFLGDRLRAAIGKPTLSVVMSFLFVGLSIPILIFILLYNYRTSSNAILSTLREEVAKSNQASIDNTVNLIQPVASTLRLLAGAAAIDPAFFRTEPSRDFLYQALISAPQIDAAYVSFEDGYHRVVTRIDDDRRRSDPLIPATANWHSSYVDDFSAEETRARHRTFFDTWPHVVGRSAAPSSLDIRTLPGYQAAKESGSLIVAEPSINPDTGYPIISIRFPIVRNSVFIGCASANITMDVLSRFLTRYRPSEHSTTIIADPTDGKIIADSDRQKGVRAVNGKLEVASLANLADDDVREAYRRHSETNRDSFLFRSPVTGEQLSASFTLFPDSFGQPWQVINLTPINDFVGALEASNRQMLFIIIALTAIELSLIYLFSLRLARPIADVSEELKSVESLAFESHPERKSNIGEIAQLQSAAELLRNSLKSFSSFVPLDVVRQLIKSRIPLTLGVEPRFLTVFFSDLENFSSQAESLAPNDLLVQMSTYFEAVSSAITQEGGTIDKFIGDGVMAFWNAPVQRPDHVLRAGAGALRAARRMERVNEIWEAEGRPRIRIRIGLNCANVLVGNVGSSARLSYTALGDGVNVAARLEGINKLFGTTICISDSIFEEVQTQILARPLKRVQVKGRRTKFMIYELLAFRASDDPELQVRDGSERLSAMTWQASRRFEAGDFAAAERAYRAILDSFPGDPVAKSMLVECEQNRTKSRDVHLASAEAAAVEKLNVS